MNFFVYILHSKAINKYYIGQTYDINLRLQRHQLKTSKFTKQANDWTLVYQEDFLTRKEAMNRERQIKNMKSRKYIEELIRNKAQL